MTWKEFIELLPMILPVMFAIGLLWLGIRASKNEAFQFWVGVALQVLGVQFILLKLWDFLVMLDVIKFS